MNQILLQELCEVAVKQDFGVSESDALAAAESMNAGLNAASFGACRISSDLQARIWLGWAGPNRWQPIRLMLTRQGTRAAGLPEGRLDFQVMSDWCAKNCRSSWLVEDWTVTISNAKEEGVTFWFDSNAEAIQFALKWMPFRCS